MAQDYQDLYANLDKHLKESLKPVANINGMKIVCSDFLPDNEALLVCGRNAYKIILENSKPTPATEKDGEMR